MSIVLTNRVLFW